jgi:hypothetical protein
MIGTLAAGWQPLAEHPACETVAVTPGTVEYWIIRLRV